MKMKKGFLKNLKKPAKVRFGYDGTRIQALFFELDSMEVVG